MRLLEAIKTRDATTAVRLLDAFAGELGIDSLIDFLTALPEIDADFVRPLCVIRVHPFGRAFHENRIVVTQPKHELGFAEPSGFTWSEDAGRWLDGDGKPWTVQP